MGGEGLGRTNDEKYGNEDQYEEDWMIESVRSIPSMAFTGREVVHIHWRVSLAGNQTLVMKELQTQPSIRWRISLPYFLL